MIKGKTYEEIYGIEMAKEKKKIRKERMILNNWRGDKNPNWVGDNFKSLSGLHDWIRSKKQKPNVCEHCKKKSPIDLSLKNGKKYSRNVKDYEWLCRRCHMIYDGRIKPKPLPKNKCKVCNRNTYNKFFCSNICRRFFEKKYGKDIEKKILRKKKGLYYCKGCNNFLEKQSFGKCKSKTFGIATYCKKCISRKYYVPKKAEVEG